MPLSPNAVAVLIDLPRGDDRCLPLSGNSLRLAFERLRQRVGVDNLTFHDIRHVAVSRFVESGFPPERIPQTGPMDGTQEACMPHITIVDKPCGYCKSTEINRNFKKSEKYIAVVPYLSEVERFIKGARTGSDFILTQPICNGGNKRDHCEKLIRAGKSIACTH